MGYAPAAQIIKINQVGELINEVIFTEESLMNFHTLIKNSDSTFLCLGEHNIYDYEKTTFFVLEINNDLEILNRKDYNANGKTLGLTRVKQKGDHFVLSALGWEYGTSSSKKRLLFYEINNKGDSIHSWTHEQSFINGDILINKNGFYYFGQTKFLSEYSDCQITILDPSFQPISWTDDPYCICDYWTNVRYINENRIIYTGFGINFDNETDGSSIIGKVALIDTLYSPIHSIDIHVADTDVYLGGKYNMDFIYNNRIYISSTVNVDSRYNIPYQETPSWIMVTQLDSNLNTLWQHRYGGDKFYFNWCITATSDGGCILTGDCYDVNFPEKDIDVYVIKLDSLGILVNTTIINIPKPVCSVYPNPGNNIMHLEIQDNLHPTHMEIYDMSGKKVYVQNLNNNKSIINTTNLKPGNYIYKVFTKRNKVLKGKWMKR